MNSRISIQVQVLAAQAMRQIAQLQGQLGGLSNGFGGAASGANRFGSAMNGTRSDRFGSQMQWLGRQLQYNFTLPIIAAGSAAAKWSLDNEKAMARVVKVYGDGTQSASDMNAEIKSLGKAFEALSNQFGVAQSDVINIAADWAAAGASGLALAKAVKLTMETMVLGELDAAKATESLIAIQAQYGQSTSQLSETIATLNMVENQTGISLAGLIDGFARSAGVARSAGIDVRHLAAMLAAMSPAAGSAAQAGNALKTIISRLLSPTKEATQVLGLMGINTKSMTWQSANATDRLMQLGKAFNGLSSSQKAVVSSVIASRFQINKFEVLVRELTSSTGFYAKALQSTADSGKVYAQMQRELNTVLSSNPKRLEVIWTMLKNAAADVIQPMIPLLLALASVVQNVVTWFSNLNPSVQKLVIALALMLAAVGPVVTYLGAFRTLIVELANFSKLLIVPLTWVVGLFRTLAGIDLVAMLAPLGGLLVGTARGFLAVGSAISRGIAIAVINIVPWIFYMMVQVGTAFRAGMMALPVIAAEVWYGISRLFMLGMGGLQVIMLAGARALGVVWRIAATGIIAGGPTIMAAMRAVLFGLQTMLVGFAAFFGGMWRGIAAIPATATVMMGRGLTAAMTGIIPAIRAGATALTVAFSGPWGWAAAAVIAVIVLFRKQIVAVWNNVVSWFRGNGQAIASAFSPIVKLFDLGKNAILRAFNALPQGIQNALLAVVRTVRAAAMAVYDLFSWLNPWARHSPSLVDNVTTGVTEIVRQYRSLGDLGSVFAKAGMDLASFGAAVRRIQNIADARQFAEMRKDLASVDPGALGQWDQLYRVLGPLRDRLQQITDIQTKQEKVVGDLKGKLDDANAAYDAQDAILRKLQDVAKGYQDQLDAAKDRLDKFANAPIEGMKAMGDAIFANQMEQKKLQLQLMKMEDAVGPLDKLQSRLDAIHGQMELLSGEQKSLQDKGAGSEITGVYDQLLAGLNQQAGAIQDQVKPLKDLQTQIDELGRKGQELDLTNSLQFDPLKRQIDAVANSIKELPFDQIITGVTQSRAEVDKYTAALDQANAQITAQQAVVDQAKAARDALQAQYDAENAKLQALNDAYQSVNDAIQQVTQSLQNMHEAAQKAHQESLTPGAQNFLDAAGGNFPDTGGASGPGREGPGQDQSGLIDDFTKQIADQTKNMFGLFNFLDPVKKAWNKAVDWMKQNIGPMFSVVWDGVKSAFSGIPNPFAGIDFGGIKKVWDSVKSFIEPIADLWKKVFGPEVKALLENFWGSLKDAFKSIAPEIEKFKGLIEPLIQMIQQQWAVTKPILGAILAIVGAVLSGLLRALADGIGPFVRMIGDILAGVIKIIRGIIEFVVGIFTGNWKLAWQGIVDIFGGIWNTIWGIIKGVAETIWGVVSGFVKGVVDFFKWLYDELVGHSIIPDMVNAVIGWFVSLKDMAIKLVGMLWNGIKAVIDIMIAGWNWWWNTLSSIFMTIGRGLFNTIQGAWQGVGNFLSGAWNWLKGIWNDFINGLIWIYNTYLVPLWNRFKDAINSVKDVFRTAVDGIRSIWDGLKQAARDPVDFVVGTVINKGIIGSWNWISDNILGGKFHARPFPGFKSGGPIRGAGGPRDDGILARVSNGEFIIPADRVRQYGVNFFNRLIGMPATRYPGDGSQGLAFANGGLVGEVWDAFTNPGKIFSKAITPLLNKIPGSGPFKDMVAGVPGVMMDKVVQRAKDLFNSEGPVGRAMTFLQAQMGRPYIWASAGPDGYDCSGIVSAIYNILHGKSPFSHTFSTMDEGRYFPLSGGGTSFYAAWTNPGERGIGGTGVGHTMAVLAGRGFQSTGGHGVDWTAEGNARYFAHIGHYDNGGWFMPGHGRYYNGTGKPEAVLTNRQWQYIARMVDHQRAYDSQDVARGGATFNEVHFHGDLSFPNVKDGGDAKEFISNLESLIRGI